MKAVLILSCIVAALLLLSRVRMGGALSYTAAGLTVRLKLSVLRFTVFPVRAKREKKKKAPTPQVAEGESQKPKSGGSLARVRTFLPLISDAAGRLRQKIRIDRLDADITVASGDPALTAVAFGAANALIGMMIPLLENNFNIKERRFRTAIDFDLKSPTIQIETAFSLTIGQGVSLSLRLGMNTLKLLSKQKKQKEAA